MSDMTAAWKGRGNKLSTTAGLLSCYPELIQATLVLITDPFPLWLNAAQTDVYVSVK